MMDDRHEVVNRLKQELLRWQGTGCVEGHAQRVGLGVVEDAFPGGAFPVCGVHEFIGRCREESAATSGFISGLLSRLMVDGAVCVWISTARALFPPALAAFGTAPDRVVFVDVARERDVLWAMEEALKCAGLVAVVAELQEMDFAQSRRLQLAVEKSQVTGLVMRSNPRFVGSTACAARWHIRPLPSVLEEGLPGVGFPRWEVELLKVRNGSPGCWQMEWSQGGFVPAMPKTRENRVPMRLRKIS